MSVQPHKDKHIEAEDCYLFGSMTHRLLFRKVMKYVLTSISALLNELALDALTPSRKVQ
jgi:hypothetical protein